MTDLDEIFRAIPALPVHERLRLVEQVVHDLADVSLADASAPDAAPSPSGLFADDPVAVDEMMRTVAEMRRQSRLRIMEDEGDAEGAC